MDNKRGKHCRANKRLADKLSDLQEKYDLAVRAYIATWKLIDGRYTYDDLRTIREFDEIVYGNKSGDGEPKT